MVELICTAFRAEEFSRTTVSTRAVLVKSRQLVNVLLSI